MDDALHIIDEIVDEFEGLENIPEEVEILNDLYNNYKMKYEEFYSDISSLFDELEPIADYDVSNEACRIINTKYGMEAYDENLNYYTDLAMNEASTEYQALIENSEQSLHDSIICLDSIIQYFEELKISLYQLLEINCNIDNTK